MSSVKPAPALKADSETSGRPSPLSTPPTAATSPVLKYRLLVIFCFAQFLDALNNSSFFAAIPPIAQDLEISNSTSVWMISAYQLMFAAFLFSSGRLSDLYSPKWIFIAGMLIMSFSALGAGLVRTQAPLLVLRAFMGIGAALNIPSAMSLVVHLFPAQIEQSSVLAAFAGVSGIGNVIGLIVGASLVSFASWLWILYFTAILTFILAIATSILLPSRKAAEEGEKRAREQFMRLDPVGMTVGLILFIFAVTSGSIEGWGTATVIAPPVISVFLTRFFALWESRISEHLASVPPSIWKYPNFPIPILLGLQPFMWWASVQPLFSWLFQEVYGWFILIIVNVATPESTPKSNGSASTRNKEENPSDSLGATGAQPSRSTEASGVSSSTPNPADPVLSAMVDTTSVGKEVCPSPGDEKDVPTDKDVASPQVIDDADRFESRGVTNPDTIELPRSTEKQRSSKLNEDAQADSAIISPIDSSADKDEDHAPAMVKVDKRSTSLAKQGLPNSRDIKNDQKATLRGGAAEGSEEHTEVTQTVLADTADPESASSAAERNSLAGKEAPSNHTGERSLSGADGIDKDMTGSVSKLENEDRLHSPGTNEHQTPRSESSPTSLRLNDPTSASEIVPPHKTEDTLRDKEEQLLDNPASENEQGKARGDLSHDSFSGDMTEPKPLSTLGQAETGVVHSRPEVTERARTKAGLNPNPSIPEEPKDAPTAGISGGKKDDSRLHTETKETELAGSGVNQDSKGSTAVKDVISNSSDPEISSAIAKKYEPRTPTENDVSVLPELEQGSANTVSTKLEGSNFPDIPSMSADGMIQNIDNFSSSGAAEPMSGSHIPHGEAGHQLPATLELQDSKQVSESIRQSPTGTTGHSVSDVETFSQPTGTADGRTNVVAEQKSGARTDSGGDKDLHRSIGDTGSRALTSNVEQSASSPTNSKGVSVDASNPGSLVSSPEGKKQPRSRELEMAEPLKPVGDAGSVTFPGQPPAELHGAQTKDTEMFTDITSAGIVLDEAQASVGSLGPVSPGPTTGEGHLEPSLVTELEAVESRTATTSPSPAATQINPNAVSNDAGEPNVSRTSAPNISSAISTVNEQDKSRGDTNQNSSLSGGITESKPLSTLGQAETDDVYSRPEVTRLAQTKAGLNPTPSIPEGPKDAPTTGISGGKKDDSRLHAETEKTQLAGSGVNRDAKGSTAVKDAISNSSDPEFSSAIAKKYEPRTPTENDVSVLPESEHGSERTLPTKLEGSIFPGKPSMPAYGAIQNNDNISSGEAAEPMSGSHVPHGEAGHQLPATLELQDSKQVSEGIRQSPTGATGHSVSDVETFSQPTSTTDGQTNVVTEQKSGTRTDSGGDKDLHRSIGDTDGRTLTSNVKQSSSNPTNSKGVSVDASNLSSLASSPEGENHLRSRELETTESLKPVGDAGSVTSPGQHPAELHGAQTKDTETPIDVTSARIVPDEVQTNVGSLGPVSPGPTTGEARLVKEAIESRTVTTSSSPAAAQISPNALSSDAREPNVSYISAPNDSSAISTPVPQERPGQAILALPTRPNSAARALANAMRASDIIKGEMSKPVPVPVAAASKVPYVQKIEFGEQPINREQTRRVVLEALMAISRGFSS